MATSDYIPDNNKDFKEFEETLNSAVQTNAVAWNIPAGEATDLDTWSTGYLPHYNAIKNENYRTRQQLIDHDVYKKDFVAFLRGFVQSFVVNNKLIPMGTRVGLGLKPRGLNPRTPRPAIDSTPIQSMKPLGGAAVRFTFKVEESSKRIARQPDSNGVRMYYRFIAPGEPLPTSTATDDDSGFSEHFSTRAQFRITFGQERKGHTLQIQSKWVNTSDETKNGQLSELLATVIY